MRRILFGKVMGLLPGPSAWGAVGFLCFVTALALATGARAEEIEVRWVEHESKLGQVEVTGLRPEELNFLREADWEQGEWQKLLSVYAESGLGIGALVELPAMLGRYAVGEDRVRFTPQFPLERGLPYRAVFRSQHLPGRSNGALVSATFELPELNREPSTRVAAVFPSGDEVPENLLKFYVHFSAPMSRGGIYEHIRLESDKGEAIELPFLEIDEELWNREMTRLTLFIDPGRIKRGVKPLEEIGPALEAGKKFKLVIGREWQDAQGTPLVEKFEKGFAVKAPDRTPPDPRSWRIETPGAGTREPLRVYFGEPMEHALALRLIWVTDVEQRPVEGKVRLEQGEKVWVLEQAKEWRAGRYLLAVQNTIEDLAGNNVGKPFEVDLFEEVKRLKPEILTVPFEVR